MVVSAQLSLMPIFATAQRAILATTVSGKLQIPVSHNPAKIVASAVAEVWNTIVSAERIIKEEIASQK